jgi:hypothetical protein
MDIKYQFVRDAIQNGVVAIQYLRTNEMLADIFTKKATTEALMKFRQSAMHEALPN